MQTFLPHRCFRCSARTLDLKRLRNQRNEALVILRTLLGEYDTGGWPNHPATRMWRGHEGALGLYGLAICDELVKRGVTTRHAEQGPFEDLVNHDQVLMPEWIGREDVHASHRAVLLAKAPDWYGQFGWKEQPAQIVTGKPLPYVWPV